jgi:hypothetical protein
MKLRLGVVLALLAPALSCRAPEKPKPPPNPPSITSFTVDKQSIRRGEQVTFNFTIDRATSVELIDQAGAAVAVTFDDIAGTGSAKASPQSSAFYVLRASGEGGRDSAFVQVAVDEGLQSVFLIVVPQRVKPGERVDLIWSAAGGRNVKLTAGMQQLSTMETGSVSQTPVTTTTYTLQGERADGSLSSQSATVTVVPVIQEFSASPAAAKPGEKITVSWKTAGADQVVLEEASFGQLLTTTTNVATGTFEFQVPAYFADAGFFDAGTPAPTDGGMDAGLADGGTDGGAGPITPVPVVRDGFPLRFTLSARTSTPMQEVQRALDARVGQGPSIDVYECPSYGSRGKPLTISWRTSGASRVELRANGLPVYLPPEGINVSGSLTLGAFSAETTFTLVAFDFNGLQVSESKTVRVVPPPRINTFVAPASTVSAAMKVTVTWTTADATFVMLRLKGGAAFFREDTMNLVASGTLQFSVPTKGTYLLEAYNLAGDKAVEERTIDVGAPITFSITPELMARGELATMAWDTSLITSTDLSGLFAPPPARAMNPTGFDDITTAPSARRLFFANKDDDVATITLPFGFTFPFVTQLANKLTVSTNGFVAIAPSAASSPINGDLSDVGYSGPPLLAPFWDDLDLGTEGKVFWNFDEGSFPRRVTISWHDVKRYAEPNTRLTFQVQLFETGKFIFAYKVLDGPGADGVDATIGAVDAPEVYQGLVAYNSATSAELAVDTERVWFSGNNETIGSRPVRLRKHAVMGFTIETGQERIPVYGRARAFGLGDILITEAMPAPLPSVPAGQWIEFFNPGDQDLDLQGLQLESTSGSPSGFVLPASVVPTRGFLVSGESLDAGANGDAGVQLSWPAGSVPLATPDAVRLVLPGQIVDGGTLVIARFSWGAVRDSLLPDGGAADGGVELGVSVQPAENVLVRSGAAPFSCPRAGVFGPPTQTGTPGSANEECFPYVVTQIAPALEDISGAVPPIVVASRDDSGANLALPVAFTYFGQSFTTLRVCTNGWVSPVDTSSSSLSNKTLPSATAPLASIAPFWDDLVLGGGDFYAARLSGRTLVQWSNVSSYSSTSDVLNFEIKLFDNGVIEFHYGTLTGASVNGNGATRWIENLDGTNALALGVNQPTVAPNTAFRFTPRSLLGGTP